MFLTVQEFLSHFPLISMSKDEFSKRFTVTYAKPQTLYEIFQLTPALKGKPIIKDVTTDKRYLRRDEVIDYFYEIIIVNRHKYLTCFYEAYFEFKDPVTLKWGEAGILSETAEGAMTISTQKNDPSKRLIRNLFYLELLDKTRVTNTVKSSVSFWQSLDNMYNHLLLEDRFFAPSSIDQFLKVKNQSRPDEINYNALFYLFQAYQPKASIFNPYSIKWILDNPVQQALGYRGQSIFTPVLSWGSYLTAFMHSSTYLEYVGVDVMPSICEKVEFLGEWYQKKGRPFSNKTVEILCQPSESLLDTDFIDRRANSFDTVLVCPPYYDMEIYHEGEQSIDSYPDYESWLADYWYQTVLMCYTVQKPGGVFALIANDYQSLDGKSYPLVADLTAAVEQHYEPLSVYYLQNRASPLRVNVKDRTERLLIYRKPLSS